ncbi:hypothetical protein DYP60_02140 [Sphaerochaeta halotolerans]|uniref:Uncharacterized protein n=1 Tax=Sphaerochaeta halotolerans TaxID=2293840 RepID=A0A372MJ49_9SPIR|nr:hypothetical protein DYP60_02140 [Sphaerochaeta halotolerans]
MEYFQICGALADCLHLAQQQCFQIKTVQTGVLSLKAIPGEVVVEVFRRDSPEGSQQALQPAVQVVDLLQKEHGKG